MKNKAKQKNIDAVIVAFNHFDTGGLQTLMVRISKWCHSKRIDCLLVFDTYDENMMSILEKEGIEFEASFDKKVLTNLFSVSSEQYENVMLVSFELDDYIYLERLREKADHANHIHHLIYGVNINALLIGEGYPFLIKESLKRFYSHLIDDRCSSSAIAFMDREILVSNLIYYNLMKDSPKCSIIPLPVFISSDSEPDYGLKESEKHILSIARASFPYKGYLIGLVKDFESIAKRNQDVFLDIVSFGEDIDLLHKTIQDCNESTKKRIKLHGRSSQSEINALLDQAWVYVGMGTTVLDAANRWVPSVVSWHSTMDNMTSGYFHKNPLILGKGMDAHDASEDIVSILELPLDQYASLCKDVRAALVEYYSIDHVMSLLFEQSNKLASTRGVARWYYPHCFMKSLNRIRVKLKSAKGDDGKHYSY